MLKPLKLALCLSILSISCNSLPVTSTSINPETPAKTPVKAALKSYQLKVTATFKVQAESLTEDHAVILKQTVTNFEADLEAGKMDDYYTLPDFSVKLLAGSEGSYFNPLDNQKLQNQPIANFAQALVVYPNQSYDIFKGQYANQRFYFSGSQTLPADNTAYLIALDGNLNTQVFTGKLSGQSKETEATAAPKATPTPVPLALDSTTKTPTSQRYSKALQDQAQRQAGFESQVRGFQFAPPPPPPPGLQGRFPFPPPPPPGQGCPPPPPGAPPFPAGQCPPPGFPPPQPGSFMPPGPELMNRLQKEKPEIAAELHAIAGLPPQEHQARLQEIVKKYPELRKELEIPGAETKKEP